MVLRLRPLRPSHQPSAISHDAGVQHARRAGSRSQRRATCVLITIDTLRADHVGAYGWTRARTPTLDGLAEERRAVRARVRGGADHAAVARDAADRPLSARPRRARQRPARLADRADAGDRAARQGLRDRGVRRRVPARSPVRPRTAASTSTATACPRGADGRLANERPAADVVNDAIAWLRTSSSIGLESESTRINATSNPQSAVLPVGPPLRAPRALRRSVVLGAPGARALRRGDRDRGPRGRPADRGARDRRRRTRWSSPPAITARRSASTASTRTASSSTTRRCACRC